MKYSIVILGIILVGFISADSLLYVTKWVPFDPKAYVFPSDPVISAMQRNLNHGRVYGNLGGQVESYYHIPSIEGYDPLFSRRYGEFIQSAQTGSFSPAQRSVVKLDRRGLYTDRVLDLLSVTEIYHPVADTKQSWAYPVWQQPDKFAVLYHDHNFQIFQNKTAMNRPSIFYDYSIIKDDHQAIATFYQQDFPYRTKLILADDPYLHTDKLGTGSARIVSEDANSITIHATSSTAGVLFLADTYYPGWLARVNGKEVSILRADYAFRGVVIPAGASEVTFVYKGVI